MATVKNKRKEIGKQLKKQRETKGLSRYAIDKQSELTITQVKNIENGSKAYTIDSLIEYIDTMNGIMQIKF